MQKIAVLLISLAIIGFTNANKGPNCPNFPTILDLHKCCYQLKIKSHVIAFNDCHEKYANTPHSEYCTISCVLNQTGIGNLDGSMNFTAYQNYLVDDVKDSILIDYMTNTIQDCEIEIFQMLQNSRYNTDSRKPCGEHGFLLHRCAASHGILNCPDAKWKKDNYYCDQILKETKSCMKSTNARGKSHVSILIEILLKF